MKDDRTPPPRGLRSITDLMPERPSPMPVAWEAVRSWSMTRMLNVKGGEGLEPWGALPGDVLVTEFLPEPSTPAAFPDGARVLVANPEAPELPHPATTRHHAKGLRLELPDGTPLDVAPAIVGVVLGIHRDPVPAVLPVWPGA